MLWKFPLFNYIPSPPFFHCESQGKHIQRFPDNLPSRHPPSSDLLTFSMVIALCAFSSHSWTGLSALMGVFNYTSQNHSSSPFPRFMLFSLDLESGFVFQKQHHFVKKKNKLGFLSTYKNGTQLCSRGQQRSMAWDFRCHQNFLGYVWVAHLLQRNKIISSKRENLVVGERKKRYLRRHTICILIDTLKILC